MLCQFVFFQPWFRCTRWEFVTEDGDINFQLVYMRENGEEMLILPRDRYESHQLVEKGEIVCIYCGRCKTTYQYGLQIEAYLNFFGLFFRHNGVWQFV